MGRSKTKNGANEQKLEQAQPVCVEMESIDLWQQAEWLVKNLTKCYGITISPSVQIVMTRNLYEIKVIVEEV